MQLISNASATILILIGSCLIAYPSISSHSIDISFSNFSCLMALNNTSITYSAYGANSPSILLILNSSGNKSTLFNFHFTLILELFLTISVLDSFWFNNNLSNIISLFSTWILGIAPSELNLKLIGCGLCSTKQYNSSFYLPISSGNDHTLMFLHSSISNSKISGFITKHVFVSCAIESMVDFNKNSTLHFYFPQLVILNSSEFVFLTEAFSLSTLSFATNMGPNS